MNDNILHIFICVIALICFICGIAIGVNLRDNQLDSLKEEAVKRNYAEWVVDNPKKGTTIFTWK